MARTGSIRSTILCLSLTAGAPALATGGTGPFFEAFESGFGAGTSMMVEVGNFSFGQLDFHDGDGNLLVADTSWGTVEFDVAADPTRTFYLNVSADAIGRPAWIVQNLALLPSVVRSHRVAREGTDFDISLLGLAQGTDLAALRFAFSVDLFPATVAPMVGPTSMLAVVQAIQRISAGAQLELPGDPPPLDIGPPAGVFNLAPDKAKNVIQHRNTPAVQEDKKRCLTGAFARSISWLDTEYKLGLGKTAQEIYDDLKPDVGHGSSAGSYAKSLENKQKYFKDKTGGRGTTKLVDYVNGVPAIPGVKEDPVQDFMDWLRKELTTEDVELHYDDHIVTVTGYYEQGGKKYVNYRDDETQGNAAKGDEAEKTAQIEKNADGSYSFRRAGTGTFWKVRVAISESVPPKVKGQKAGPGTSFLGPSARKELRLPARHVWNPAKTHAPAILFWDRMIRGETVFDVVAGGSLNALRASGGDFTANTAVCLNDVFTDGVSIAQDPLQGDAFWVLVRAVNTGGPGSYDTGALGQQDGRDAEIDAAPAGCPTCAHDTCIAGDALDPACSACVQQACAGDSFCCATEWDATCVQYVRTVCGSLRCAESLGACSHTACTEGEPLVDGCDAPPAASSCVAQICAARPSCCSTDWDADCVFDVLAVCGLDCD